MSATVSTELLLRVARATPEQQAAIERFLVTGSFEGGGGAPARRFLFQRAGRYWRVVFDGGPEFHVPDVLGARYLDYLLHHANRPISAFDLEVAIRPEKGRARTKNPVVSEDDAETMRRYLRELARLRADREEAAEGGDFGATARLDEEISAIEAGIRISSKPSDTGERARCNVGKALTAIRRQLGKGGKAERAFGEHLDRALSVGYECLYSNPEGDVWA